MKTIIRLLTEQMYLPYEMLPFPAIIPKLGV